MLALRAMHGHAERWYQNLAMEGLACDSLSLRHRRRFGERDYVALQGDYHVLFVQNGGGVAYDKSPEWQLRSVRARLAGRPR